MYRNVSVFFFLVVFVTVTWCGRGVESVDVDGRGSTHACLLFALEICEGEAANFASVWLSKQWLNVNKDLGH